MKKILNLTVAAIALTLAMAAQNFSFKNNLIYAAGVDSVTGKEADPATLRRELAQLEKEVRSFSLIFEKVAQLIGPSVVKINVTKSVESPPPARGGGKGGLSPFFNPPDRKGDGEDGNGERNRVQEEIGSGAIIDKEGYIVTNYHVVKGATEGTIKASLYDGKVVDAKLIGVDPKTDLAVIKIEGSDLPVAEFGDFSKMRVGDWVIAIGSPLNYQQTVSAGIISAIGRKHINPFLGQFAYEDFIQTDVSINPGSSGGPLVNLRGEIIGINSAIATRTGGFQGIAFAISATIAKKVTMDLIKNGKVLRGFIGVGMIDIDQKLANILGLNTTEEVLRYLGLNSDKGSFVAQVWDDTPASKAGMVPGDVLLEIDNKIIDNSTGVQNVLRNEPIGATVEAVVVRNEEKIHLNITIGEQPESTGNKGYSSVQSGVLGIGFGLVVRQLTPEIARTMGYRDLKGIIIVDVKKGSSADKAGLEPGDIITEADSKKVGTLSEICNIVYNFKKSKKPVSLKIKNKGIITLN